jgi:membrane-bound serine protease (ClpP class)
LSLAASSPSVFIFRIDDEIDPRMARRVRLALAEATKQKSEIVLIEMDTYGGALTDADAIRKMVLEFPKPIWIFVNKNAASAGALISIAADSIYMSPAASMGAATVVNGSDGDAAPDKYQSFMRSLMRSTAEANKRNPKIAEAMVDGRVTLDSSLKQEGQVLTLTTSEAIKYAYCEGQYASTQELLKARNISSSKTFRFELSTIEGIIAFFLNPFLSGILIMLIIAGLYYEMQHPGIGFALGVSVVAAILYFVPYYLNGLAANWEVIVFFIGVILLAAEVFVIPGFGIAGISGIVFIAGSLVLMMLNNDYLNFEWVGANELTKAVTAVFFGLLGSICLMFFIGARLIHSKQFQKATLQTTLSTKAGYATHAAHESMLDRKGTAYTVLRPSGKVQIDGEIYDALTRGEYIEAGTAITVVGEDTTSLKVKAVV